MKKKIVRADQLTNHWNILLTAVSTVLVMIGLITTFYLTQFETRIDSKAAGPTGIPYVCKGDCIYSVEGVGADETCYRGYCLDPNISCSFNVNCGWVAGCSNQNQVSCPDNVPTATPADKPTSTPIPPTTTWAPPPTLTWTPSPTTTWTPSPTNIYLSPTSTYYYPTTTPTRTAIGGPEPSNTITPTNKPYISPTIKPSATPGYFLPSSTPKPTITMAFLPSITPIPTITPFPTTPPPPTATPIPPIGPLGCKVEPIDVHGNPSDKYDVLFLSQGFHTIDDFKKVAQEAVSSVSSSNFNSAEGNFLYNKLNFWINADITTNYSTVTSCIPGQVNSVCWNFLAAEFDTHVKCNADGYIILINSEGDGGMALIGRGAALSKKYARGTVHELGHVMCMLNDEYVGYPGIVNFIAGIPNTNCSQVAPCPWANKPGLECIQGCTDGNWFRSSKDSIMNNWLANKNFNKLSLAWCSAGLQNFR